MTIRAPIVTVLEFGCLLLFVEVQETGLDGAAEMEVCVTGIDPIHNDWPPHISCSAVRISLNRKQNYFNDWFLEILGI